jgi:hypothetical protein
LVTVARLWSISSLIFCGIAAIELVYPLGGSNADVGVMLCRCVILSAIAVVFALVLRRLVAAVTPNSAWLRTVVVPSLICLTATTWASHGGFVSLAPVDHDGIPVETHGFALITDGQYVITLASVERILDENGYLPVEEPRSGDLIVYRDERGRIIHVGRVKATGERGFVLIESQLPSQLRFHDHEIRRQFGAVSSLLHEPDQHGLPCTYAYFRSPQPGHRLSQLH